MNNDIFTFDVNEAVHKIRARTNHSDSKIQLNEISSIIRISSAPPSNSFSSVKDNCKVIETKESIRKYARYWGEPEENIDAYIKDQLGCYPLDDLIYCFRLLNADIQESPILLANVANVDNAMKKY